MIITLRVADLVFAVAPPAFDCADGVDGAMVMFGPRGFIGCFLDQVLLELNSALEKQAEPLTFRPSYFITHV